ncbi:hypothetical protein GCM10022223_15140 [Kineosporia mesophila]|uniref:Uncharacterized protein n=1 Tax=Kineosporia mesophila TaxID=566012 RepID=A0ABP6Z753_9ACTN
MGDGFPAFAGEQAECGTQHVVAGAADTWIDYWGWWFGGTGMGIADGVHGGLQSLWVNGQICQ